MKSGIDHYNRKFFLFENKIFVLKNNIISSKKYQIINKYKVFLFLPENFRGGSGSGVGTGKGRGRRDHGDR